MGKIGSSVRENLGLLPNQKELVEADFEAFGIQKVNGKYALVKIQFVDGKVDTVTRSELDNKAVALERFKIETSRLLLGGLE